MAIFWYMNGQVTAIQKERDIKMAKVANLETLQEKLKLLKEKDLQVKAKLSLFPSGMIVSVPYRDILREVSQILPDNVTLTLLTVQNKGKNSKGESQTNEGMEFHISGLAFGSDEGCLKALALVIERLERSPLFNNVKLDSADENKLYTRPGAGFEIVCDINLANPPFPSVNLPNPPFVKGGEVGMTKGDSGD
jgi:Tfp pilus assembly protein PilN